MKKGLKVLKDNTLKIEILRKHIFTPIHLFQNKLLKEIQYCYY